MKESYFVGLLRIGSYGPFGACGHELSKRCLYPRWFYHGGPARTGANKSKTCVNKVTD
ncbi:hypothetical protein PHLCEN_2v5849 [Hermanssonia centrifuga]|uniref:Uncharacterized protein n=1 Tax=Hermanssonia centrifuga TaxID=98765 RepID=A0A2R6P115_9APHY|nr:hypothetical protein PHLCEN_2v5849 [Hermanssonia centrifuga]